jgi:hypothetical protein
MGFRSQIKIEMPSRHETMNPLSKRRDKPTGKTGERVGHKLARVQR